MEKIKVWFIANKITAILVIAVVVLGIGGLMGFKTLTSKPSAPVPEVDLSFDAEGPYALLFPRRDGNALNLDLKRTASYDSITYELAYTSLPDDSTIGDDSSAPKRVISADSGDGSSNTQSIDRGVVGTIETKDKKGEYEQEILFGTCSKNVCKYDKGVENGTLTMHIRKGNVAYKMITEWHLQQPDVALGVLTSGDSHFVYKMDSKKVDLTLAGYSIINDLTGLPKLPDNTTVVGKVYAVNVPLAKELPAGQISIELANNPPAGTKIARFDESKNTWDMLDTTYANGKLTSNAPTAGIFAVLAPSK